MLSETIEEARRQSEICNACRYCEGFCSVFPAMHAERKFSDGDIVQLANLCHNCRGCYYACQFTAPHEFDLNLPKALAETRQESWKEFAWPGGFSRAFDKNGAVTAASLVFAFILLFSLSNFYEGRGEGFYQHMSHGVMVAVFLPAFLFPIFAISVSLRKYWNAANGGKITLMGVRGAFWQAAKLKNLSGGHGKGCNFEDEDRYTQARRYAHQLTMYGFLLCFASTSSGTILHYAFDMPAPYPFWSLPKLSGVTGGVLLCAGTAWLAWLKTKADPKLGALKNWNSEMAFIVLLFLVSLSGLALYAAPGTKLVWALLPIHLAAVLAFFVLTPYSKMVHGFYRLAALILDAARKK